MKDDLNMSGGHDGPPRILILTLSKQKTDTLPQMLMRGGLMQKTPCRFSLL